MDSETSNRLKVFPAEQLDKLLTIVSKQSSLKPGTVKGVRYATGVGRGMYVEVTLESGAAVVLEGTILSATSVSNPDVKFGDKEGFFQTVLLTDDKDKRLTLMLKLMKTILNYETTGKITYTYGGKKKTRKGSRRLKQRRTVTKTKRRRM